MTNTEIRGLCVIISTLRKQADIGNVVNASTLHNAEAQVREKAQQLMARMAQKDQAIRRMMNAGRLHPVRSVSHEFPALGVVCPVRSMIVSLRE